jgi:TNF receptor-associated factor 4
LGDSVPDTRFKRGRVKCPKGYKGCHWKNEFGRLREHLNPEPTPDGQLTGCQFYKIQCLDCKELVRRGKMVSHQNNQCPMRPFTCKRCDHTSTYEDITKNHDATCTKLKMKCPKGCGKKLFRMDIPTHECPEDIIDCIYKYAGCQERVKRKNMESHLEKNEHTHKAKRKSNKDKHLLQERLQVQPSNIVNDTPACPAELILSNFNDYEPGNKDWYSTPFCTHSNGYKLCLKASVCSRGEGGGRYVFLSLHLMKSRFDETLRWPLKANFEVFLMRCGSEEGHHTDTIKFNDTTIQERSLGDRVIETERATNGPEIHNFIALAQLKEKYLTKDKKCRFLIIKNEL